MGVSTAAGAKFYIGTTALVGSTDTFVEIGGILSISEFGRVYNEVTYSPLSTRAVEKFKGSYNDGGVDLSLGRDTGDVGQAALRVALDVDADYNFKYEPNDAVPARTETVTISVATPGVFTNVGHGFSANTELVLATSAADLPSGLTAGTVFVKTVLDADTFTVSLTAGGAAIDTADAGTGTHTVTTVPAKSSQLMKGKVMSYTNNNGEIDSVIGAMCKIGLKSGSIVETAKNPTS